MAESGQGDESEGPVEGNLPAVTALFVWIALAVPWAWEFLNVKPYMDEIFHVPQAQKYCEERLHEWDPKITTFPGLYLFSAAPWLPSGFLRLATGWTLGGGAPGAERCPVPLLRAANLLFGSGCLLLLFLILRRRMGAYKAAAQSLVLSLYPIHFFYTFLYYTDVGSLFWTLLAHHLATPTRGRGLRSTPQLACAALAGLVAIAFRQTNAVWLMFTFGTAVLGDLQASPKWAPHLGGLKGTGDSIEARLSVSMLMSFARALVLESNRLLKRFGSLLLPVALFAAFVVKNGSVVVGDHSNHQAVIHWAQLAYLSAVTASLWGLLGVDAAVSPSVFKEFLRACLWESKRALRAGMILGMIFALVRRYSLVHPYLLADNRHYTFYVWNRFLGRIPVLREALTPVYFYCGWLCYSRLSRAQSDLWFLIWCIACVLTLVPAHLLEPRYWTTAVILAHAHAPERSWISLITSGGACIAVNAATLLIFLRQPFTGSDGELARFMW